MDEIIKALYIFGLHYTQEMLLVLLYLSRKSRRTIPLTINSTWLVIQKKNKHIYNQTYQSAEERRWITISRTPAGERRQVSVQTDNTVEQKQLTCSKIRATDDVVVMMRKQNKNEIGNACVTYDIIKPRENYIHTKKKCHTCFRRNDYKSYTFERNM